MGEIILRALSYLGNGFLLTVKQLLLILGPVAILGFIMNYVAEYTTRQASRVTGSRFFIYFTFLGTVIHELGHAVFCPIFGHSISDIQLFTPNHQGSLGHVSHSYRRDSIWALIGNFFIGTGPIWLGSILIYLLSRYLMGLTNLGGFTSRIDLTYSLASWSGVGELVAAIKAGSVDIWRGLFKASNLLDWKFWVYLYLVFSIGSGLSLSAPDFDGALRGFGSIFGALLLFNWATAWIGNFSFRAIAFAARYISVVIAIMVLALVINVIISAVFLLISSTGKLVSEKVRGY